MSKIIEGWDRKESRFSRTYKMLQALFIKLVHICIRVGALKREGKGGVSPYKETDLKESWNGEREGEDFSRIV
jgi:hypothetical protein